MKGIYIYPHQHQFIREHPDMEIQTRRLDGLKEINQEPDKWSAHSVANPDYKPLRVGDYIFQHEDYHCVRIRPRYRVDEIAFIQEAWATEKRLDHLTISELGHAAEMPIFYKLDNPRTLLEIGKWRSPLFMPAWAARDFIKILAVRAERLQEITREDVLSEGCSFEDTLYWKEPKLNLEINWFHNLWDSINPKYPWNSNPFVFVYTFKKVEKL